MHKNGLSIILAIFLSLLIPSATICGDLNAFYSMDYEGFWKHWNKVKNDAVSCTNAQKTSMFFSNAIETLGNAEVSEANAREIESLALKSPECLLKGLSGQLDENKHKFIKHFLIHPIYNDATLIEKSLNTVWGKQIFLDLKKIYHEIKEAS